MTFLGRIFFSAAMLLPLAAIAGEVEILHAEFTEQANGWLISTTLRHDDTGWKQYADAWRIVSKDGNVLATRVLYHPHVNEQPFTRSLHDAKIPADLATVLVQAHCNVHGWSKEPLRVNLMSSKGPGYQVKRLER